MTAAVTVRDWQTERRDHDSLRGREDAVKDAVTVRDRLTGRHDDDALRGRGDAALLDSTTAPLRAGGGRSAAGGGGGEEGR